MLSRALDLVLAALALLGPFAIHLFFPVIPVIKVDFQLTDALAQLTFSIGVFGMAFSTLAYGNFADRYGRRPVLLIGLALYLRGKRHLGPRRLICQLAGWPARAIHRSRMWNHIGPRDCPRYLRSQRSRQSDRLPDNVLCSGRIACAWCRRLPGRPRRMRSVFLFASGVGLAIAVAA